MGRRADHKEPGLTASVAQRLVRAVVLVLLCSAAFTGCSSDLPDSPIGPGRPPEKDIPPFTASTDGWTFSTGEIAAANRRPYLGNGYLGFQTGITGCGWEASGDLPAFVAGLYENESLVEVHSPAAIEIRSPGGQVFGAQPSDIRDYHQELHLKSGRLRTRATWLVSGEQIRIRIECFPHRRRQNLVVTRLEVENPRSGPLSLALRTLTNGQRSGDAAIQRNHLEALATTVLGASSDSRIGEWQLTVPAHSTSECVVLAVETSRIDGSLFPDEAVRHLRAARSAGVKALDAEHDDEWAKLWESALEIKGDPEAQSIARLCQFYLWQSIRTDTGRGVPPMGLSSSAFAGHVFWDMDTWMLPAVILQHPALARDMLAYRKATLEGALQNARNEGRKGAAYAWESASTGLDVAPPEFRRGRHINGDIALAMRQYWYATQDRDWLRESAWPVLAATSDYWLSRAEWESGAKAHVRKVYTPDELAGVVDDSAWTNYVAQVNLNFATDVAGILGIRAGPRWERLARALELPRHSASGRILEHAGYDGRKSKQADTLLLLHPGGMKLDSKEAADLYDYYSSRVIQNGPAMTDAIHAVVAARLGRGQSALEHFRASYRPFIRPSFAMFSEKRSRDNLCFLTGAGGVLQAILYGFAGLDLRDSPTPVARPQLPPGWESLTVRGVHWRNRVYDLHVEGRSARWTPTSR